MLTSQEQEAFNSIKLVGYKGPLLNENEFKKALQEGTKSVEFSSLIHFLTNELGTLCNLDESVNAIATLEDSISFVMEISSFLNELGCPHTSLIQGHVSDRLGNIEERILLIEHLASELIAARIVRENHPEKKIELKLKESPQAADLRKILQTLKFPKPPPNISMAGIFQKLIPSVENAIKKAGPDLLGNPIFNGTLSQKQWQTLENVNKELYSDYMIRREMLLKRLDCTIQSFQWSDKTKGRDDTFEKTYSEKRKLLKAEPDIDLSDLLASRDDLAIIEKTSSALVRKNTKSSINKVIIGEVPDRGGRTSEQAPPPPEMPSWQQRSAGPPSGGYRGGGQQNRGGRGQQQNNNRRNYNNYGDNPGYSGDYNDTKGNRSGSFDSAGSYGGYNKGNYSSSQSYDSGYSQGGGNYRGSFDSAGGYSQDYQEPKRARTFDDYQMKRTTYTDQYVQEDQHNQQYHAHNNRNRGGHGRSSHHRGGRGRGGGRNYR